MSTLIEYDFSRFTAVTFIILIFIILLLLKVIKILLPRLLKKRYGEKSLLRHYATFELLVWLVFLFWSLPFFYKRNLFYAAGISLFIAFIIAFVSWYALRDIVAGFVIRNNPSIATGNKILYEGSVITIAKLNANNIEGRLENGNIIRIPYGKIIGLDIEQIVDKEQIFSNTIELKTLKADDFEELKSGIKSFLYAQPGTSLKQTIEIVKTGEYENKTGIRITYYAVDSESIIDVEKAVRKEFEET